MEDYYSVLKVSRTATINEIKAAFKNLSLKHHPDKQGANTNIPETRQFIKIYEAWTTLNDPNLRVTYDRKLADYEALQILPVDQELVIDDMNYDENEEMYRKTCRCGGEYAIVKSELNTEDVYLNCDTCSLCIHVYCTETNTNE
ncbi:hypothetical protein CHUAL_011952 [Chamberlinius hualienensis]